MGNVVYDDWWPPDNLPHTTGRKNTCLKSKYFKDIIVYVIVVVSCSAAPRVLHQ